MGASSLQNVEERGETQDQRNGSMIRTWPNFTGVEDEGMGPEGKECRLPLEAGQARKPILPWGLQEKHSLLAP